MRFKKGQKVTLKKRANWGHRYMVDYKPMAGPKFGEVVTVDSYPYPYEPEYCAFEEYQQTTENGIYSFWEGDFEPLISDAVLRLELESVPEPFTI